MVLLIRRDLRRDERGVASTVGTIMALLVFLTFLSLIVNQYVPVWMKDSESAHVEAALAQFGGIKQAVDFESLNAQVAQSLGVALLRVTDTSPVGLGVDGVPIFSVPTQGVLTLDQNVTAAAISFSYSLKGVPQTVRESATGALVLNMYNNYAVPTTLTYVDGGILRSQSDGQVFRAPPLFQVQLVQGRMQIRLGLVTLFGTGQAAGSATEMVSTQVLSADYQVYTNFTANNLEIEMSSAFGLAWFDLMNQTMANALHLPGVYQRNALEISYEASVGGTQVYELEAELNPVTRIWSIELEIRNTSALPLGELDIFRTFVSVSIDSGLGAS